MLDGFYVFHPGSSTKMYTPALERQGQAATFAADIVAVHGTVSFVITVEHKNLADATWGTATTFTPVSAAGLAQKDAVSLKEQVRLAFHFATGTGGDFVYLALAAIGWRAYD
jgi:hypothetical protein